MEEITNCDQCFNFCPIEAVKCDKGRRLRDCLEKELDKFREKDKGNIK